MEPKFFSCKKMTITQRTKHLRKRNAVILEALVETLVEASAGDMDVSVKCRIGAHDTLLPDGACPDDSYETLHAFVEEAVAGTGASQCSSSGEGQRVVVRAANR